MEKKFLLILVAWVIFLITDFFFSYILGATQGVIIPFFIDENAPDGDVEKAVALISIGGNITYHLASFGAFYIASCFMLRRLKSGPESNIL